jgi:hypothetical protein
MERLMESNLGELKKYLNKEFKIRVKHNSSYSKRAFSRDLGISPTSLNDFLAGKRNLGFKNVDKVFKYLSKKSSIYCSWCDKERTEVRYLIGGPRRQYICNECVDTCVDIGKNGKVKK